MFVPPPRSKGLYKNIACELRGCRNRAGFSENSWQNEGSGELGRRGNENILAAREGGEDVVVVAG
jgi:hypothetical protein